MTKRKSTVGPLHGVRVLDLGTMIAGPVAATLLSDFGAEVIKVEQPEGGDPIRKIGPFVEGEGLWWNVEGRNKKSITLNLREQQGQELLKRLVQDADVLVENFRPGTMEKWGLGYESLSACNPRLVYLSVSGYGQTGPYSRNAAFDRSALAFAGLLNMTGFPDRPPVRPGVAMADYQSALFGAFAVMLALYQRDVQGGTGQHADVSLYESVFRFTDIMTTAYDKLGLKRNRNGNMHFAAAPGDHFKTADGRYVAITISNDSLFRRLCNAMGTPEMAEHPDFCSHDARWSNIVKVNQWVADWIATKNTDELVQIMTSSGLPVAPILGVEDIVDNEHYKARESIVTVKNQRIGDLKMPAATPRLVGTPAPPIEAAPLLGAHNSDIYQDALGLSEAELAALKERGVI